MIPLLLSMALIEIPYHTEKETPPTRVQQFSPDHTICASSRMPGWKRVIRSTRHKIPQGSQLRWFQTITCIDYSKKPVYEFYMLEEWWKR